MKIAAHKSRIPPGQSGWRVLQPGELYDVFRSGEPFPDCLAVDTETGVAWRAVRDESGAYVRSGLSDIEVEMVLGFFELRPKS